MIIILSGGIGSGKSVAAGMLEDMYGFPVYCADDRVKQLYDEHPTLMSDIEKVLGEDFRDGEGTFVPSSLARRIFSDGDALAKVESLVFPILKEDFLMWVSTHPSSVHVLESATILEKDFFRGFGDFALIVTAPFELRLRRAMKRDSASEQDIRSRMEKQILMNDPTLVGADSCLPTAVCQNVGSMDDLRSNLAEIIENRVLTKML